MQRESYLFKGLNFLLGIKVDHFGSTYFISLEFGIILLFTKVDKF